MLKPKDQLIHELSNLLSYIRIAVEDSGMSKPEKRKICDWIRLAGLLVHFENIFIKHKISLSDDKTNLPEILELVISMNKPTLKGADIEFENPEEQMFIKTDQAVLEESLDLIIKYLADVSTDIRLKTNPRKSMLEIRYKTKSDTKIVKTSPYKSLKRENLHNMEIPLQLALELFAMQKIGVKISKGLIILKFPVV